MEYCMEMDETMKREEKAEDMEQEKEKKDQLQLWPDQQKMKETILQTLDSGVKLVMIDGPASCGKTVLLQHLSQHFRGMNKKTVTGLLSYNQAAKYVDGRVIHSILHSKHCSTDLLFIDSINLVNADTFELLEKKYRDECSNEMPFGGISVVLCGDFFQLPAYTNNSGQSLSVSRMKMFQKFILLKMDYNVVNEHTQLLAEFRITSGNISVPKHLFVQSETELIEETFGMPIQSERLAGCIILAPSHTKVDCINEEVFESLPGDIIKVPSETVLLDTDRFPSKDIVPEVLRMDMKGYPKVSIKLKSDCVIALTDNVKYPTLSRGTRLIFRRIEGDSLICNLLNDPNGPTQSIEKTNSVSNVINGKYRLRRSQFPVTLGYAMTIHRAQGLHFERVGIYQYGSIFEHGQMYTAMSRCHTLDGIRLYSSGYKSEGRKYFVGNIVYKEICSLES